MIKHELAMKTTAPPLANTCALCQKAATRRCIACKDAPSSNDTTVSVYYCTVDCQKEHWTEHKSTCSGLKARKLLYNAGLVLQELFYVYREKVFDKLIAKIEIKEAKLYVHEGRYPKESSAFDFIHPFPNDLFANDSDKKSVLVHMACSDAIAWMQEVVQYLLADIVYHIAEIAVKPKNNKRNVVAVDITGKEQKEELRHCVWRVVLKNSGERYILDFSGAQFGYYKPVTPLIEYFQHRVQHPILMGSEDLGSTRTRLLGSCGEKTSVGIIIRLHESIHTCLKGGVLTWEEESKMKVNEFLLLPTDKFNIELKKFLMSTAKYFDEFLQWLKDNHENLQVDVAAGRKVAGVIYG